MKRIALAVTILVAALALTACAPDATGAGGGPDAAGFLTGWWQGFTVLFTFLWSLFNDNVAIYEVNNSGGWYDFGYLLGIMMFWGGGGAGSRGR